jgi:hypothetical protein
MNKNLIGRCNRDFSDSWKLPCFLKCICFGNHLIYFYFSFQNHIHLLWVVVQYYHSFYWIHSIWLSLYPLILVVIEEHVPTITCIEHKRVILWVLTNGYICAAATSINIQNIPVLQESSFLPPETKLFTDFY